MNDMFTHYASMIDQGLESREDCEIDAGSFGYTDIPARIDAALRRLKAAQKANTAKLVKVALAQHAAAQDHESGSYTLSSKEGSVYKRAYLRERERLES